MVNNLASWFFRALVVGLFVLGACSDSMAQGWPKLSIEIQSYPNTYLIKIKTADGRKVKNDIHLQAVAIKQNYRSPFTSCSKKFLIGKGTSSVQVELSTMPSAQSWTPDTLIIETNENERYNRGDYLGTQLWSNYGVAARDSRRILYVSDNITSVAGQSVSADTKGQSTPWGTTLGVSDPKKLPSFDQMLPVYLASGQISAGVVTSTLSFLQTTQNTHNPISCITPGDFFEDWKSLTYTTTIFVSNTDLAILAKSKPKMKALQNWLFAGGQLVVFDAGKKFEKRSDIVNTMCGTDPGDIEWSIPSDKLKNKKGFAANYIWNTTQSDSEVFSQSELPIDDATQPLSKIGNDDLILMHFGHGTLFLTNSDMIAATKQQWQLLFNSLQCQESIIDFIGTNCQRGQFQQTFRIPGIGKPPVLAFQILIGLYVMLIGPLLYFFLHSSGRLYLLLVSIPLVSLLAVGALFMYGFINDGFSIRGRVKSISFVDEKTQKAVTHSRQVYYSGVRPKTNVFDDDVYVSSSRSANSARLRLHTKDGIQMLSGGHIRARSPFQLTEVCVVDTDCRVLFSKNSDTDSGSLINRYPDRILSAVVRTKDGYYMASEIDPESAGKANKVDIIAVNKTLRDHFHRIKLNYNYESRRFRSGYASRYPDQWGLSTDVISEMDSGVTELEETIPVNGYILILDSDELMPNPQPSAIIGENRLHVIIGKW